MVRASVLTLLLAGCAVRAPALDARHPANPSAPPGRLAGAPASTRAGVVVYPDVPAKQPDQAPPSHHHHHAP